MSTRQYSKSFIRFELGIFFLLEIAWSCSAWGYMRIGTFSMSFIPVMVIMGAYLFGSRVGMMAGCLFGLTSMMVATINAGGIPADAIFSPFNSGRPLQSILLCYVPRITLGLIAGIGFGYVQGQKVRRWKLVGVAFISLYVHAWLVYIFAAAMFPEVISWNMLLSLIFLNVNKLLELFIPCLMLLALVRIKNKPSVQACIDQIADGYDQIAHRRKIIRYSILMVIGFLITLSGVFVEFIVFVQVIFSGNESSLAAYQQMQIDLLALQQVIGSASFVLVVLGVGVLVYCYFLRKEIGDKERIQREMEQTARARKKADDALQVNFALAKDFLNVFLLNPKTGMAKTIKLDGYVTTGIGTIAGESYPFQEMVRVYVRERVYESDHKKVLYALSPEGISKNLCEKDEYSMVYQVFESGAIHYYQAKIIRTAQPEVYIVGFQNVDSLMQEEKRKQKMYEAALASAESANRAKTDFLSRMSHDIRTPINGIIGMAHIMESRCDDQEKIKTGINDIKMLSHQLESLVNDVLEMSRIESGKTELRHETCHLPSVLDELTPAIQVMAESRNVVLAGSHYEGIHETVVSSPLHIQRIVSNIVSNAVKYNRPGGTVECWLQETPIDQKHSEFLFTVKDTGIGMSEEYLKKIFEPFSREQVGIDTYYSGTGLGMTITKELVDRFGGTIEIDSKQNVGTTVRIRLPLELGEEVEKQAAEKEDISLEGMKILIVEDNQVNLSIAEFIVEEEKATVDTAVNGKEAVDKFAASEVGSYDLILMDMMMPVMDGLTATRAIRKLDRPDAKTVPILAMTANAFEEDIQNCLAAGMNAHIAKPINVDKMKQQIRKAIIERAE